MELEKEDYLDISIILYDYLNLYSEIVYLKSITKSEFSDSFIDLYNNRKESCSRLHSKINKILEGS